MLESTRQLIYPAPLRLCVDLLLKIKGAPMLESTEAAISKPKT